MKAVLPDLRDAWRGLRRDRLYAAAVIGTLALTLGASVAVFAIVDGILLRPLGHPEPDRLVSVREIVPAIAERYPTLPVTMRHFEAWREGAVSFTSMAATDWRTSTLTGHGDAVQVVVLRTSGTLFDVLRIPTALGRGLTREDERRDRPPVVVISDQLWRERLASDPSVAGRPLTLNGVQYTIAGVLPRGYALPRLETLGETASVTTEVSAIVPFRVNIANFDWMGQFNYGVIARLKPGVTLAQARAEMAVLQKGVADIAGRETGEPVELRAWLMPLEDTIAGPVRRGLTLLMASIAVLLLIACANLANLTLTRTLRRLPELAVRGALGATRWRLVRGVIAEQALLAVVGGASGIALAAVALRIFVVTAPVSLPRAQEVTIDARVVAFGATAALLAALAVALLPAFRVGRGNLEALLRGGRVTDGGMRVRAVLLAIQVALAVMLLVTGGLFVASLSRVLEVDTGFSPGTAMTVEVAPVSARYPDIAARAALYDRVLDRVRALSGVTSASWTSALPLTGETWVDRVVRADAADPRGGSSSANYRFVGPEYFAAIGMPVLRGRGILATDRAAALTPAVVSARVAAALWPGEDALGREFTRANPAQRFQIVGIVGDGRVTALESDPPLMVYVPYWFNNDGKSVLVVRSQHDALALVPAIRAVVQEIDPEIAVARVAPLAALVDSAVAGRRYQATLFMAFGASALLIAVVGVYATTAYGVSRRRRELNIRLALGARGSQVFSLVLRQSALPLVVGLGGGLAGALAAGGAVASLLYEVPPRDPTVLGVVLAVVAASGIAAAAAATLGGLRVNPAAVLRED